MKIIEMKSVILRCIFSLFTYFSPVTTILLVVLAVYYIAFKLRRRRLEELIEKVPGPTALPLIGNVLEISTGFDGKDLQQLMLLLGIFLGAIFSYQFLKFDVNDYEDIAYRKSVYEWMAGDEHSDLKSSE